MARDDGGHWLPIHTGLLRDERFARQTARQRGVWLTLFLLLDGEPDPGWFRDAARAVWLLRREGISEADAKKFGDTDWLVPENANSSRLTIRGWHEYTGYEARKAVHNRGRGDRSAEYARRGTTRAERDGAVRRPRRDETRVSPSRDGEHPPAREGEAGRRASMKGLKEVLGSFDEVLKAGKKQSTDDTS